MSYVEIRDLKNFLLDHVRRKIRTHAAQLRQNGLRLVGLIAFGPVVQGTSLEELDLIEVVEGLGSIARHDVTDEIGLGGSYTGRVLLTSMSPESFRKAFEVQSLFALRVLEGHELLLDSAGLAAFLRSQKRALSRPAPRAVRPRTAGPR